MNNLYIGGIRAFKRRLVKRPTNPAAMFFNVNKIWGANCTFLPGSCSLGKLKVGSGAVTLKLYCTKLDFFSERFIGHFVDVLALVCSL